jgi:hypothetical protein
MVLGMLEDARFPRGWRIHLGLTLMTILELILGAIAFGYAWSWAGQSGPVHKLTSRACGVALGYLAPAAIISHALYFHWVAALQAACANGLLCAIGFISRGSIVVSN